MPVADISVASATQAPTSIDLSGRFDNSAIHGTLVRLRTSQGDIVMEMMDAAAPATVANFLSYVNAHRYDGTFIDAAGRSDPADPASASTSLHGGGYSATYDAQGNVTDINHIPTRALIADEAAASHVNTRGTIAIDAGSGTSDWLINLADNGASGNAVFGTVIVGMDVADAIEGLPTPLRGTGHPFAQMPLANYTAGTIGRRNLVLVQSASVVPEIAGFAVSSSDPHIVSASVSGASLLLDYSGGGFGTAEITVTATDVEGSQATDTFTISVRPQRIAVSTGGADLASGQSAPLDFGLSPLNGTGARRTLRITNVGSGTLSLGDISVPAGYHAVTSPSSISLGPGHAADLVVAVDAFSAARRTGTLTIASDDPTVPLFTVPLTADVGYVVNLSAGKIPAVSFTDADGTVATVRLTGPGSAQLSFAGADFSQLISKMMAMVRGTNVALLGITLRGTSPKTKLIIDGKRGDGVVRLNGLAASSPIGTLDGRTVRLSGKVSIGGVQTIAVGSIVDADVHVSGAVGKLSAGSITRMAMAATGGIAAIAIRHGIASSTVRAARLGTVSAQSLTGGSNLYAGYGGNGLPQRRSELAASGTIKSVVVGGGISASNIVARSVGDIVLGTIQYGDAHGSPFGVVAASITSLSGRTTTGGSLRLVRPTNMASIATALRKVGRLGDFTVRIL